MATKKQHQTETVTEAAGLLDQVVANSNAVRYKPFMSDRPIELDVQQILDQFCAPTRNGFKPSVHDARAFMRLCEARGLNPWEGDAFLVGYDTDQGPKFSLITAHQAFLKRAEVHPDFDGMESGVVVQVGDELRDIPGDMAPPNARVVGGWARVHHKQKAIPTYRRLSLQVFAKNTNRWKIDPGGMICKCAEADALRSSYPTKLGGIYLRDELPDGDAPPPIQMPQAVQTPEPAEEEPARMKSARAACAAMESAKTLEELAAAYESGGRALTRKKDAAAEMVIATKENRKRVLAEEEIDALCVEHEITQSEFADLMTKAKVPADEPLTADQAVALLKAVRDHVKNTRQSED